MSKKQDRINKLVSLNRALNSPIKGAGANATQCTYNKELVLSMMNVVEEVLALDGVFPMNANEKTNQ